MTRQEYEELQESIRYYESRRDALDSAVFNYLLLADIIGDEPTSWSTDYRPDTVVVAFATGRTVALPLPGVLKMLD
jgi:hypothetical protein